MITVKYLKELLAKIPNDAIVYAYDTGEDVGIHISYYLGREEYQYWWISVEGNHIEGFDLNVVD